MNPIAPLLNDAVLQTAVREIVGRVFAQSPAQAAPAPTATPQPLKGSFTRKTARKAA